MSKPRVTVAVFWDIENVQPPSNCDVFSLVQKIRASVSSPGDEFIIEAYGNVASLSFSSQIALGNANVKLVHIAGGSKNSADIRIVQACYDFIRRHNDVRGAVVVVVSSDINFLPLAHSLANEPNVSSVLIHMKQVSPHLMDLFDRTLVWPGLETSGKRGAGFGGMAAVGGHVGGYGAKEVLDRTLGSPGFELSGEREMRLGEMAMALPVVGDKAMVIGSVVMAMPEARAKGFVVKSMPEAMSKEPVVKTMPEATSKEAVVTTMPETRTKELLITNMPEERGASLKELSDSTLESTGPELSGERKVQLGGPAVMPVMEYKKGLMVTTMPEARGKGPKERLDRPLEWPGLEQCGKCELRLGDPAAAMALPVVGGLILKERQGATAVPEVKTTVLKNASVPRIIPVAAIPAWGKRPPAPIMPDASDEVLKIVSGATTIPEARGKRIPAPTMLESSETSREQFSSATSMPEATGIGPAETAMSWEEWSSATTMPEKRDTSWEEWSLAPSMLEAKDTTWKTGPSTITNSFGQVSTASKKLPRITFICFECSQEFKSDIALNNHQALVRHTSLSRSEREKEFNGESTSIHEKSSSINKDPKCMGCECSGYAISLSSQDALENHHQRMAAIASFMCTICGKKCASESALKNHRYGMGHYDLVGVGSVFKNEYQHVMSLPKDIAARKGPKCLRCGKIFASSTALENHEKSTGHDVFKCTECEINFATIGKKNFVTKRDMNLIMERETNISAECEQNTMAHCNPALVCDVCKMQSTREPALKLHKNLVKHYSTIWICGQCGAQFLLEADWFQHQKIRGHKDPRCPVCAKTFSSQQSLLNHQASTRHKN